MHRCQVIRVPRWHLRTRKLESSCAIRAFETGNRLRGREPSGRREGRREGRDHDGRTWEIDILAANGTEVVVVEVKTTLKVRDVDHFLQTLRHFHRLMPEYGDKLAYGAAAYLKPTRARPSTPKSSGCS